MKALSLVSDEASASGSLRVVEVARPQPQPNEALVRVELAGLCGTDLSIVDHGYRGYRGILGHEFVGLVDSVATEESTTAERWTGRRVVGEINLSCGDCELCSLGHRRHCLRRKVLGIDGHDGCFTEYLCLPIENLHLVPEEIPAARAVWSEPLAAAIAVLETRPLELGAPTDPALVLGDGRLATLIALALHASGQSVRLRGKHPLRVDRARQLGIPIETSEIRRNFGWVIEATGQNDGIELARQFTRPRGTIVLKSTGHGTSEVSTARLVVDELKVVGSRCGDFAPALELLARLKLEDLVDEIVPLERGLEAVSKVRDGAFKILLKP